jgi:hypothetical protein
MSYGALPDELELAELVRLLDRRMDTFERGLNRLLLVLGSAQIFTLVLLLLVLWRLP